jgi:hypothetical protein
VVKEAQNRWLFAKFNNIESMGNDLLSGGVDAFFNNISFRLKNFTKGEIHDD